MLARQREARCAARGDGFRCEQAFYGDVVKDVVFKSIPVLGDDAFFVRLRHVAEDVVEYGNGERVTDEVQRDRPVPR